MEDHGRYAMEVISFGDAEIAYSEHGVGEPILLVHAGVFGDWFLPWHASPTLESFRVIRDDVAPDEVASYGLYVLTAASSLSTHDRGPSARHGHSGWITLPC